MASPWTLKDFGPRVQLSVFEADVTTEELDSLYKKLERIKLGQEDSIRVYRICGECANNIKIFGIGEVTKERKFYIV